MPLPVFISGFRSGTTLLANLLGLHPSLAAWFETKELCEILRWLHVIQGRESAAFEAGYCIPATPAGFDVETVSFRVLANLNDAFARLAGNKTSGKAAHESYPLGFDCIHYTREQAGAALVEWQQSCGDGQDYPRLAEATGRFITQLAHLHCKAANKPFWVNKTPEIGRFGLELHECLGPIRMIYLVRDGLQVAASGYRLGWADIRTLAYNWQGLLQRTRLAMQDSPDLYLEVRYEDLIRHPGPTLTNILRFCGLEQGAEQIVDDFRSAMGATAFDTSRLGKHEGLSPEQVAIFMEEAGQLYAALGYSAC
jgi:hypothetical protein